MTIASGSQALASDILHSLNQDGYIDLADSSVLTIAAGAITVSKNWYKIETEAGAASDDLDTITLGANVGDGHLLFLRPTNDAHTIVLKNGTGNISLSGGDLTLDDQQDTALLIYDSALAKWVIVSGQLSSAAIITAIANNSITRAQLVNGGALTVIGRAANSSGAVADITATVDGQVLQRSGSALGWGTVPTLSIADNAITKEKIATSAIGAGLTGGGGTVISVVGTPATNPLSDKTFINDTSDANMTYGIVINQGANTDEVLAFKASTSAHGMTTLAETDTWGSVDNGGTKGGLVLLGLSDNEAFGDQAVLIRAACGKVLDTTKSTSAIGGVELRTGTKSGTSTGAGGATGNLATISNDSTVRFIFQADGSAYEDVGTAFTNYDEHDDAALLNLAAAHLSRDPIREGFSDWMGTNRQVLEDLGLVVFNEDGHHFVNRSRMQELLMGAVRQANAKLEQANARMDKLLAALATAGIEPKLLEGV